MEGINTQRTYLLGERYETVKERAGQILHKYLQYPSLFALSDPDRSITFLSEKLIPAANTSRPRVMLLFSNPHPYSVLQGMFLSPNTRGRKNLFWSTMEDAGWTTFPEDNPEPKELANLCLSCKYGGPFELVFYCYYAFPTEYPEDIRKIFGKEYFSQAIEPEAKDEFMRAIQETSVNAVIVFNKEIFNRVSTVQVERYVERLMKGELIQSEVKGVDKNVPIYLTFPTGWRYHKQYMQFREAGLDKMRTAICSKQNVTMNKE